MRRKIMATPDNHKTNTADMIAKYACCSTGGAIETAVAEFARALRENPREAYRSIALLLERRENLKLQEFLTSYLKTTDLFKEHFSFDKFISDLPRLVKQMVKSRLPVYMTEKEVTPLKVILISGSSRRKDILTALLPQEIHIYPVAGKEYMFSEVNPGAAVTSIAIEKSLMLVEQEGHLIAGSGPNTAIISSDTFVASGKGERMGKIDGKRKALDRLIKHSQEEIKVFSSLMIIDSRNKNLHFGYDQTLVKFHPHEYTLESSERALLNDLAKTEDYRHLGIFNDRESISVRDILEVYASSGRYEGKAGGFGLQDRDLFLCVEQVNGDPLSVMGLPVNLMRRYLHNSGIALKDTDLIGQYWPDKIERKKIKL